MAKDHHCRFTTRCLKELSIYCSLNRLTSGAQVYSLCDSINGTPLVVNMVTRSWAAQMADKDLSAIVHQNMACPVFLLERCARRMARCFDFPSSMSAIKSRRQKLIKPSA